MKAKIIFIFVGLLFSISIPSFAQIKFQKTFGGINDDAGYSVQQTTDGGYIIAGTTNSFGPGNYSVYLIKTNANGDTLWTKTFGGSNAGDAYSVQQTTDGGYIIAGETKSTGAGDYDVYLIKTNENGATQWTKTFGGSNSDWGSSVRQTNDNGYVVVGTTYSFGNGNGDVYLIKTNANGDTLWTKILMNDMPVKIIKTNDNNYLILGLFTNIIKINISGDILWGKGPYLSRKGFRAVKQTLDGGYIICGWKIAGSIDYPCLFKISSSGDSLWERTYTSEGDTKVGPNLRKLEAYNV